MFLVRTPRHASCSILGAVYGGSTRRETGSYNGCNNYMKPLRVTTGLLAALLLLAAALAGCASRPVSTPKDAASAQSQSAQAPLDYRVGPGDTLQVFVWRNPDFSVTVPVRPDGKISTPLVEDLVAVGRTPTELAREMEQRLSKYIRSPVVTVIVTGFVGSASQQIRVIGEAVQSQAIPYRSGMSVLDVMIAVGGLTEFASGNRATIIRDLGTEKQQFRVRLEDLLKNGDISANVTMQPGDILIIPQSWF